MSTRFGLRTILKSIENPHFIFCFVFQNLRLGSIKHHSKILQHPGLIIRIAHTHIHTHTHTYGVCDPFVHSEILPTYTSHHHPYRTYSALRSVCNHHSKILQNHRIIIIMRVFCKFMAPNLSPKRRFWNVEKYVVKTFYFVCIFHHF